eukprot:5083027-Prymnesium_polylepis.1
MENVEHGGAAKIILYWPSRVLRRSSSKNVSSRKSSSASPCAGSWPALGRCPRRARARARAAAPPPAW